MSESVRLSHSAALMLKTLKEGYSYGFDIMDITGLPSGTVYPALRRMESDGLIKRTVHPVIPPHVDYELTSLGLGLSEAFCPIWTWVYAHYHEVNTARAAFRSAVAAIPPAAG